MTFQDWLNNGWLRPHTTSPREITDLLAIIDRDLKITEDPKFNNDWRFNIAYNAALACAALALKAAGYEVPKGGGAHFRTIDSLRLTIADDGALIDVLQAFRDKRGGTIYEAVGIASTTETEELRALAMNLRGRVLAWLKAAHPQLLSSSPGSANKGRPRSK